MTTLAVDTERMAMASDSQITAGSESFESDKIFVAPDGTLVGICGDVEDALLFQEWYVAGANRKDKPTFSEPQTFSALTLNKEGCFEWGSPCVPMRVKSRFRALGSGGMAARAAAACGKSLEEAVQIAIECDIYSGGPIVVREYKAKRSYSTGGGRLL